MMRQFRKFLNEVMNLPYKENLNSHEHEKSVRDLLDKKFKKIKYVYQPNGSQQYPDFHFIEDDEGSLNRDLDCKSCKTSGKPMYNSGMPHLDGIYIFTTKQYGNTLYFGQDVCSPDLQKALQKEREHLQRETEKSNKRLAKHPDNDRGWNIYFRPDFNNKGESSNYFKHPRRTEVEQNVLEYYDE